MKIQKLKTKLHNERDAHRQWKEEATEFMDEKYHLKEKVLIEREKSLEETIRRMTLSGDSLNSILPKNTSPPNATPNTTPSTKPNLSFVPTK